MSPMMPWESKLEAQAKAAAESLAAFVKTIAALRHPQSGCPWDLQQTHASLRRFMLEEAYEAAEAMLGNDTAHLLEELGDVLLQVVLNAQLCADDDRGDLSLIIEGINSKMLRRHPHVFAPEKEAISSEEVKKRWDLIKKAEKKAETKPKDASVFAKARKVSPALTQSFQIGKTAKTIDFDWDSPSDVLKQLRAEIDELQAEIDRGDLEKIPDELGDCFFSLAQLSRHLGYEPEEVAQRGNLKFLRRFDLLEALARQKGLDVQGRDRLEDLWQEVKAAQKQKNP